MKRNFIPQKTISILLIFILIVESTGCYSTRVITTSDLSTSDLYKIHCKNALYDAYGVILKDSLLTGYVDLYKAHSDSKNKTHIYLSSDSALRIMNDVITIPIKYITKIEQKIPDTKKTKILSGILIAGACVGLAIGGFVLIGSMVVNSLTNSLINTISASNGCKIM
jgi:hypothetical protein